MNVEPAQCGVSLVIAWSFKSRPLPRVTFNQMIYLALSFEVRRSAGLARRQNLHVIFLSTPAEQSARNLARRRGVPQSGVAHLASSAQLQRASIETACDRLRQGGKVEELDLDQAHARVRQLLGLGHTLNAGGARPGGLALPSSP